MHMSLGTSICEQETTQKPGSLLFFIAKGLSACLKIWWIQDVWLRAKGNYRLLWVYDSVCCWSWNPPDDAFCPLQELWWPQQQEQTAAQLWDQICRASKLSLFDCDRHRLLFVVIVIIALYITILTWQMLIQRKTNLKTTQKPV